MFDNLFDFFLGEVHPMLIDKQANRNLL